MSADSNTDDATTQEQDGRMLARLALEQVCSGRELERVSDFYHFDFVDDVTTSERDSWPVRATRVAIRFTVCFSTHRKRFQTAF